MAASPFPTRRQKPTLQARLCEHEALYWRLDHGENIDDKLPTYRLAFARYLMVTHRLKETFSND
jgi:hypothetical protein